MRTITQAALFTLCLATTTACSNLGPQQPAPPVLSTDVRDSIGHMAVRVDHVPTVSLASDLDTKGKAAGKTALASGAAWLGGTAQAAAGTGDPFGGVLVLAMGLATTPFAAAGGAIYGAASADTKDAISQGNEIMRQTLSFAPARLRHSLEQQFGSELPVRLTFVAKMEDAALKAQGFDSVLDVRTLSITSVPDENDMHVELYVENRSVLTNLGEAKPLAVRERSIRLPGKAVSSWAANDGRALLTALDAQYSLLAQELKQDFFLRPSLSVQGLTPVSKPFTTARTETARPTLRWAAINGSQAITRQRAGVQYEVSLRTRRKASAQVATVQTQTYRPSGELEACQKYYWKVRAHYPVFGKAGVSEWSPEYRFKTPCR